MLHICHLSPDFLIYIKISEHVIFLPSLHKRWTDGGQMWMPSVSSTFITKQGLNSSQLTKEQTCKQCHCCVCKKKKTQLLLWYTRPLKSYLGLLACIPVYTWARRILYYNHSRKHEEIELIFLRKKKSIISGLFYGAWWVFF